MPDQLTPTHGTSLLPSPWRSSARTAFAVFGGTLVLRLVTVCIATVIGDELTFTNHLTVLRDLARANVILAALTAAVAFGWNYRRSVQLHQATRAALNPDSAAGAPAWPKATGERAAMIVALNAAHRRAQLSQDRADEQARVAAAASAGVYELVTGMVQAEERIRAQLVADLHDTVAQELVVAGYIASDSERAMTETADAVADALTAHERLTRTLPSMMPQDMHEAVQDLTASLRSAHASSVEACGSGGLTFAETVKRCDTELRAIMAHARPPELAEADLTAAVEELVRSFATRDRLNIEVSWPDEPIAIPYASALTLYRFCQETLRNVIKHAGVDRALVTFAVDDGALTATVVDHGIGMRPGALDGPRLRSASGHHVGLDLLRNRAEMLGASVDVSPTPGGGTTVTLRLPTPMAAPAVAGPSEPYTRTIALGDRLIHAY